MYSKETDVLKLPQWQPKDHPDFLTDMNEAYRKIDKGYADNLYSHQQLEEQVSALSVDFVTVKEQVADLKEKVDKLVDLEDNPVFIELKERVDKAESDIIELQKKDVTHDDAIEVINNTLNSIERQLDTIEEHLENHDTEFQKHDEMIRDIKIDIAHLQDDIVDLRKHVAECETSVAEMETKVGHIEAEQIRQTEQISNLTEKVDGAVSDVNGLKDQVGFNTDKISAVETEIGDLKISYEEVQDQANKNEANIESLAGNVASIRDLMTATDETLQDHEDRIVELEKKATSTEDSIEQLVQDNGTLTESIADVRSTANSALEGVTQNSRELGSLTERVETLENNPGGAGDVTSEQFNALEERVEANETSITGLDTRVTSLEQNAGGGGDVTSEQFEELEGKVTALEQSQTTQDSSISAVETDVAEIKEQVVTGSEYELLDVELTSPINLGDTSKFDTLLLVFSSSDVENSGKTTTEIPNTNGNYRIEQSANAGSGTLVIYRKDFSLTDSTLQLNSTVTIPTNTTSEAHVILRSIYGHKKASSTALSQEILERVDGIDERVTELEKTYKQTYATIDLTGTDAKVTVKLVYDKNTKQFFITPSIISAINGTLTMDTEYQIAATDILNKMKELSGLSTINTRALYMSSVDLKYISTNLVLISQIVFTNNMSQVRVKISNVHRTGNGTTMSTDLNCGYSLINTY